MTGLISMTGTPFCVIVMGKMDRLSYCEFLLTFRNFVNLLNTENPRHFSDGVICFMTLCLDCFCSAGIRSKSILQDV